MHRQRKLIVSLMLFAASASADTFVYAVSTNFNNFTGQFGTVDLSTGAFNQIGHAIADPLLGGLVQGPNGSLLSASAAGNLDSVNPATGAVSVIGAISVVNKVSPIGVVNVATEIAELNGTLYATDLYGNLYTVNAKTGAATFVGVTGIPLCPSLTNSNESSDEALFTVGGKLFATFDGTNLATSGVVDSPELYQINPATGVATRVGPTALGIDAAVQQDGTVYGFAFGYAGPNAVLSLNVANGNTTFLNDYNALDITGAAAIPTPEPASLGLLAAGIAAVLVAGRRRFRGSACKVPSSARMLFKNKLTVPLALAFLSLPVSAGSLVYIEGSFGAFGTLNLQTGAFQQIGPGLSDVGTGLVAQANGSLLTLGYDGTLDSINPVTGIETIGPKSLGDCSNYPVSPCGANSALAFGSLNGKLYATDFAGNFYTINPATGQATKVGSTGLAKVNFVPGPPPNPVTGTWTGVDESLFSAGGKLFANEDFVTINPNSPNPVVGVVLADDIYQIDTTTGQATPVAPTLTPLNSFVNVNGTEYGFDGNLGQVVSLSLTDGKYTTVSSYDPSLGQITGASPVAPEPPSITLAVTGILGTALLFRRRSQSQTKS
jgi:hypothetical protein